jgi:beta-lactam-binding protein with PASTA domain
MVSSVENYIGRDIDQVRMELQATLGSSGVGAMPIITLKEPFMYEYSPEVPGLILQQSPEPGTDISGPVALEFVVSRGQENAMLKVPALTGLSVSEALEKLGSSGVDFIFSVRPPHEGERGERVAAQTPPADSPMRADVPVRITVTSPEEPESGEVFNLFRYTLPKNPYPLPVRLEALLPSGERIMIFTIEYPGGEFTVPYRLPVGSVLILSMVNREIYRETVNPPVEALSPDQL